jgi:hypothetical protein
VTVRAHVGGVAAMLVLVAGACGGTGATAGAGGAAGASAGSNGASGSNGSSGSNGTSGTSGAGSNGASGTSGGAGSSAGGAGSGQGTSGQGGSAAPPDGGGASDAVVHPDAVGETGGAPGTAPLTQFLRIIQVTTVQGAQTVSISIDGQKNHSGAIHAGQALMMRIHVRPDTGWVAHPTVAELHLMGAGMDVTLSATRTITGASSAPNLESTFNFDLTAGQVTKDLRFQVALRDPTGTAADPPPAVQRALYPRDGTYDTLDAM